MLSSVETQLQVVVNLRAEVGEGPVPSADGLTVHWVDIFAGLVHTTDLASGRTSSIQVDTWVGAVARRAGGGLVAAVTEGFATITAAGDLDIRRPVLSPGIRMNDAKCDPAGRFWAGSTATDFAAGCGALHMLRPDWTAEVVLTGLTQPNGLGWSPDGGTFYLVDSQRRTLSSWDFDLPTGALANERLLLTMSEEEGAPDGLTVDASGDIWLAVWGGGVLLQLSPSGDVRRRISVPVRQPSSCAFAGAGSDRLIVTSAAEDLEPDPTMPDGALLALTGTGARGLPTLTFAG